MKLSMTPTLSLSVAVAVPLLVGLVGGIATSSSVATWYAALGKPAWNPPNWVCRTVWTALYVLMGVASWLVWQQGWDDPSVRGALILFAVQLALNLLWWVIFFGLRQPGWAAVEVIVLWAAVLATLVWFTRLAPLAGVLLAPYQLWVTFAVALNASIWWLSRSRAPSRRANADLQRRGSRTHAP